MPLTCEMLDLNGNPTGKLIIDRDNLIWIFPKNWGGENLADQRRNLAKSILAYKIKLSCRQHPEFLVMGAGDELHSVIEHVSEYDRSAMHMHHRYSKDIHFDLIKEYFDQLDAIYQKDKRLDKIIANRKEVFEVITKYFAELTGKSTDSKEFGDCKSAHQQENFYRQNKTDEYSRIVEQRKKLVEDSKKPVNADLKKPAFHPPDLPGGFNSDLARLDSKVSNPTQQGTSVSKLLIQHGAFATSPKAAVGKKIVLTSLKTSPKGCCVVM